MPYFRTVHILRNTSRENFTQKFLDFLLELTHRISETYIV